MYVRKNSKQIRVLIGLKLCFSSAIRLLVRDFYNAIFDEGAARIEIESE